MKKIMLFLFFGLTPIFSICAKNVKVPGEIIYANDTSKVTFIIPLDGKDINFLILQFGVKYIDASGAKKKLKPNDAQEIRFTYKGDDIRMLSRFDTYSVNGFYLFLKLEIDDYLKLFRLFSTGYSGHFSPSSGTTSFNSYDTDYVYLQKGNEPIKRFKPMTVKKEMMEYFKDCPELVKKIENKELKKDEIVKIVNFYNSNCKK